MGSDAALGFLVQRLEASLWKVIKLTGIEVMQHHWGESFPLKIHRTLIVNLNY